MATPGETARVLLVRLSALGDVATCLPGLASLRAARPEAEIGWLVEDRNAGLIRGNPHVDRLFVFERRRISGGGLGALVALRRELRTWRPDVAVDLQGNLKGAFLARLSGAPRRVGLPRGEAREGAHLLATERVAPGPPGEHRTERALRLLRAVGAHDAAPAAFPEPDASARTALHAALQELGADRGTYAVLVPGTSAFGAFKRWPPERFAELARRLHEERGLTVLVSHGPGERDLAEVVVRDAGGAARLGPTTDGLPTLVEFLRGAALVVGADSGPVLLASLAGTPTVALYGPKDPRIYAPRVPTATVVRKGVYCSPCTLRRCGDPICMTTLGTDEAWEGVERVLPDAAPHASTPA